MKNNYFKRISKENLPRKLPLPHYVQWKYLSCDLVFMRGMSVFELRSSVAAPRFSFWRLIEPTKSPSPNDESKNEASMSL